VITVCDVITEPKARYSTPAAGIRDLAAKIITECQPQAAPPPDQYD
jgi:hypothetical protein